MNTTHGRAKPVVSTLGAAAAATVAVAATAAGAATADAESAYQTPSGNIVCTMGTYQDGRGFVACEVADHTWAAPPRPAGCHLNWGSRFRLEQGSPVGFDCYGQPLVPPGAPTETIDDGHSQSAGTITCDSAPTAISCTDSGTGHYFRVSRDSYMLG